MQNELLYKHARFYISTLTNYQVYSLSIRIPPIYTYFSHIRIRSIYMSIIGTNQSNTYTFYIVYIQQCTFKN